MLDWLSGMSMQCSVSFAVSPTNVIRCCIVHQAYRYNVVSYWLLGLSMQCSVGFSIIQIEEIK